MSTLSCFHGVKPSKPTNCAALCGHLCGHKTKQCCKSLFYKHNWRRWRDSNPRCGYKPHAPLAGEYLQPLGHISVKADILAQGWPGSSAFDDMNSAVFRNESILIKLEGPVQRTDSQFHVFVFDHHRCLDLAGADHLDVDALFCQGAEHQAGNTHVTAHANAHNGHLAHLGVGDDFAGADRGSDFVGENLAGALVVVMQHGK